MFFEFLDDRYCFVPSSPQSTYIRHHFLTAVENTLVTMSAAIFNYRYAVIISKQWFLLLNTTKIEKSEKGVI